jgi:hypothetical protein
MKKIIFYLNLASNPSLMLQDPKNPELKEKKSCIDSSCPMQQYLNHEGTHTACIDAEKMNVSQWLCLGMAMASKGNLGFCACDQSTLFLFLVVFSFV